MAAWLVAGAALCASAVIATDIVRTPREGAGERLVASLAAATGLRIETNGPGEIDLFPTPHIRMPGVSLARAGEAPFAAARELTGSLRIGALLRGRIELGEITLVQADVALDRAPLAGALAGLRRSGGGRTPLEIRLTDARLTVAGRAIDHVQAGLAMTREGGPLSVSGFGRYSGQPVEASFQLTDPAAFGRGERAPFRARVEGGGARLMFDGEAIDQNGPRLVGELSARATALGDTLAWLGLGRAAGAGPRFSLSLAGRGSIGRDGLAVSNAELDLSGDSFMGAGRLTLTSDGRPSVEATVDADALDVRPYAAVLAPQILQEGGWSTAAIDLGGLKGWTLDLRLSAASLRFGRLLLGQTAATVAVGRGGLDLSIGEAEAYGGTLGGRLSLEPDQRGVKMSLEGGVTDIAFDEALAAVVKHPQMSGTLTGELAVAGAGGSVADFVADLSGKASGKLVDGALEKIGRSRTLALAGLGRRMDVSTADAAFRIEKGIARTSDISIVGDDARFALAGAASLVDRDVKLKGVVRPTAGGWAVPVTLEGPLSSPKLRPDLGDYVPRGEARRATTPAEH
ncbi:AsmA family protein [Chelatococcus sambhunathii]|uniref:AsmA family protein n=1 Tax=Chelatococcus sambhunathii TaxID=363953 RepID=A0ABU1DJL2_9HYPH|nr:AsmA-like C-terminal region-containing protein [Chelatococcus sambhunathii]MDR4308164.1 AsmA family protein [Chelatococcus sambhunathii]